MSYENARRMLDGYKDCIAKDTIDLINIPSVSQDSLKVKEALEMFMKKASEYGLHICMTDTHSAGAVEIGEGDETVGILVHLDVVDAGDMRLWESNAFEGRLIGGKIYGRGALDDKGAAVLMLHVLRVLKEINKPFYKKIQLIAGTQEEVLWTDMKEYADSFKLPDYGFSPDGEFPVQNKEKGYIDVELIFESGINQDGEFEIISLTGGNSKNTVPESAEAVLKGDHQKLSYLAECYDKEKITVVKAKDFNLVKAFGKACHSSVPEKGKNAINVLSNFLYTLSLKKNQGYNAVRFITEMLSCDYFGKKLGFFQESDYFKGEFVHQTTIVPVMLNTEKNTSLLLNLRTRYGTTKEEIKRRFVKQAKRYRYERILLSEYLEPLFVKKDRLFIAEMGKVYEEITGFKNEFILAYGTTYAKAMPDMVSWGPLFPGEPDSAHQPNESIGLDNLMKAGHIYLKYLYNLAFSQTSFK